jgi:hypothetical protein
MTSGLRAWDSNQEGCREVSATGRKSIDASSRNGIVRASAVGASVFSCHEYEFTGVSRPVR